ncbi:MAG: formate hydrogenlyase [Eubacteriaceae bacterium]|nr:formate hydrogenlyase [Eubacteriaceae bacterium]
MAELFYVLLQIGIFVLISPLVSGVIKKVKAMTQKRKGAPVLQLYFDLTKLLKKQAVISDKASWIFKASPYVVFSTAIAASLLIPVTTFVVPGRFSGDIIMLVYLLALGRFFMTLSGLDTGSTFGGMGSSREVMISSLMEPSILVSVFTMGLIAKSTSVYDIMEMMQSGNVSLTHPVFIMIFLALLIITLAETSRIPVDDPATHLELTMVHEAMILEYSGRHLALMELGASIKQLVFITLIVNIFLPHDQLITYTGAMGIILSIAIYILKVVGFSVLMALAEVSTVKFRLFSVPNLAALSFMLSFLGFLQYFVFGR